MLIYFILIFFLLHTHITSVYKSEKFECSVSGSVCNPSLKQPCCSDARCELLFDFHYACIGKSNLLGVYCSSDHDCDDILHAKCSKNNECVCRSNNIRINNTCAPVLEGFCWNNEKCATPNSSCVEKKCRCNRGFFTFNNQCIFDLRDITCNNTETCKKISKDTICSNKNQCQCYNNYVLTERGCTIPLNMACITDKSCADSNSACIDNVCQCKLNFKTVNETCVLKTNLHAPCTSNADCDDKEFTVCGTNKTCICKSHYIEKNGICLVDLRGFCRKKEQCADENSVCIDNKCQCASLMRSYAGQCPKIDLLGKDCKSNSDCKSIINSSCLVKKCVCNKNFMASGESACVPILNGPCSNDDHCVFKNSACIDKMCQCRANFTSISTSQCVENNYPYFCEESSECSDTWHAMCSEGKKCVCKSNTMAVRRSCLPLLNGLCWRDDQCMVANSQCYNYRCSCKVDFIAVANNLCARK